MDVGCSNGKVMVAWTEPVAMCQYMGVCKNNGIPKSSILIGFSIINHPFWGTLIFGNTHMSKECQKNVERVSMHSRSATIHDLL